MNKLFFMVCMLVGCMASAELVTPTTVSEMYKTSVRIYNLAESSGGTGSIFKSYKKASHILTNKHVCRIIEQGGSVEHDNKRYDITHYKKFPDHDLCLVRVGKNLNVSTLISDTTPKRSSIVHVSGHPNLLPHIVTRGHLSDSVEIQLVIGTKKCEPDDKNLECAWFGGIPIVETFDSRLVSNLIKPGSSGSAVYNTDGKVVGVVYAGNDGSFSYGFIVPHLYVLMFIQNAHKQEWVEVGTPVDDEGLSDRIFNYNKCKKVMVKDNNKFDGLKEFCKSIQDNFIWRKL